MLKMFEIAAKVAHSGENALQNSRIIISEWYANGLPDDHKILILFLGCDDDEIPNEESLVYWNREKRKIVEKQIKELNKLLKTYFQSACNLLLESESEIEQLLRKLK